MSTPSNSYYALLNLPITATSDQIRAAYLRLAKELHPDRAPVEDRGRATAQFQELARAYKVLSDPALRTAYDASHTLPPVAPSARPTGAERPPPDSPFPGHRVPPGGYPFAQYSSRPPASRRPSWSAPDPFCGSGLDPFALFEHARAQAQGGYDVAPPVVAPSGVGHRPGGERERAQPRWTYPSGDGAGCGRAGEGLGVPRTRRREWSEARQEANGDGIAFQAMEEVEHTADGGVRWSRESVTFAFASGVSQQHHTHLAKPHEPSTGVRRPASPAHSAFAPSYLPNLSADGYRPRSASLSRVPAALPAAPPASLPIAAARRHPPSDVRRLTYPSPSPTGPRGALALPLPPRAAARRPPSPARGPAPLALPPAPFAPNSTLALPSSSRPRRPSVAPLSPRWPGPDSPLFGAGEPRGHAGVAAAAAGVVAPAGAHEPREGRERERVMRSFRGRKGEGVV